MQIDLGRDPLAALTREERAYVRLARHYCTEVVQGLPAHLGMATIGALVTLVGEMRDEITGLRSEDTASMQREVDEYSGALDGLINGIVRAVPKATGLKIWKAAIAATDYPAPIECFEEWYG